MPIFDDPTSPVGKSIPLDKKEIVRLRKVGNDQQVAKKAYDFDPGFRKLADHYFQPENMVRLDDYSRERLPTMLLNYHYYGKVELEKGDDLTAELAQEAKKMTGSAGQTLRPNQQGQPMLQNLKENLRAAPKDVLGFAEEAGPVVGATVGSFAGPLGAAAGGFAGQGVSQLAETLQGKQERGAVQQVVDPVKSGAVAGVVDAGVGLAGRGLIKAGKTVAKAVGGDKLPARIVNSLIKPGKNEFKFGKNPGQAIVDEGLVANSVDDLLQQVTTKSDEIGTAIEQSIIQAEPAQIDMIPLISKPFDDAIKGASKFKRTNEALVRSLENMRDDLLDSYGNTQVQLGVWNAKKAVGDQIKWSATDPFASDKNKVLWNVYENLRDSLNANVKGLDKLNGRYSELTAAKAALGRRMDAISRSNLVSNLSPTLMGMGAGLSTYTQTQDPAKALGAGVMGALGMKGAGSAAVKTRAAQLLSGSSKGVQGIAKVFKGLVPAEKAAIFQWIQSEMNQ